MIKLEEALKISRIYSWEMNNQEYVHKNCRIVASFQELTPSKYLITLPTLIHALVISVLKILSDKKIGSGEENNPIR